MDWQQALRARLLADGPLAALVSTRIDWGERSQGAILPAVTLMTVSDGYAQHLKGYESIQPSRVQIDVWGDTFASAQAVKAAVLAVAVPGVASNGHNFSRAMVDLVRETVERISAGDGADKTIHRVSMDLIFHHAVNEEAS